MWESQAEDHLVMLPLKRSRDFVVQSTSERLFHRSAIAEASGSDVGGLGKTNLFPGPFLLIQARKQALGTRMHKIFKCQHKACIDLAKLLSLKLK